MSIKGAMRENFVAFFPDQILVRQQGRKRQKQQPTFWEIYHLIFSHNHPLLNEKSKVKKKKEKSTLLAKEAENGRNSNTST